MRLAREGYPFVAFGFIAAIIIQLIFGGLLAVVFWLLAIFMLQFFRDPDRDVPDKLGAIVSPADGKVVAVRQMPDPISGKEATNIAIFLNVFSVHSTRIPVSGKVLQRIYKQGKFLNAAVDKSSDENERNSIVIQTDDAKDVTCIQIAGLIARRILCYVTEGDDVTRGQRYGFIRFGSRVELFLPQEFKVTVNVGDKVKGGADIIGFVS